MTLTAFFLIFSSVFLHASWNTVSKSSKPSIAFYMIMAGTAATILFPVFLCASFKISLLPRYFFLFYLISLLGEVIYKLGLARSYRFSDISYVYPVMRALPVMLTLAITLLFGLGERPRIMALLGMLLIIPGCFMMPLASFRDFAWKRYINKTIFFILLGSFGTTLYTIFDSRAIILIKESMENKVNVTDILAYLFLMESGLFAGQGILLCFSREERKIFGELLRKPFAPMISGVCSSSAYALILFSMAYVNNVSYIQAFRQMSLPIGFLAGVLILKEKASLPKLAGLILVVAGLVMVSFFR